MRLLLEKADMRVFRHKHMISPSRIGLVQKNHMDKSRHTGESRCPWLE
jgi:hypothetical protein